MQAPNRAALWMLLMVACFIASPLRAETEGLGITRERPASGRFVKIPDGYLVPYVSKIPGSNVTFAMEPVPGGRFLLGSPADESGRKGSEGPQVEVTLEPYWIGRFEVTWSEYELYCELIDHFRHFERLGIRKVSKDNMADAVTAPSDIYEPLGRYPSRNKQLRADHPAVSMTQFAARQYTKWLSKLTGQFYRLPSEAEWEYACRGGVSGAFHFGDDKKLLGKYAWCFSNSDENTHPVGLKLPNSWGLFDMHGNAAEWVLDEFDSDGYAKLSKAIAAGRPPINLPTALHPRIVRGGSWDSDEAECRSAARRASKVEWSELDAQLPVSPWWLASDMQRHVGFRIVRPLNVPDQRRHSSYWDADVAGLAEDVRERCREGRGGTGIVDQTLPAAIRKN